MYAVVYKKRATKTLAGLPPALRGRILAAIATLAADPDSADLDTKALRGRSGHRLRVGHWRVLYEIDRGHLLILVVEIGSRGDIYK